MGGTEMSKKSIRFFNDREVRAVWDDANNKWWFSATDIVRAINDEDDYVKAGNYWRWLKKKINTEGIQLVSVTHDFKFQAPDGKQRAADALDAECVQTLAKNYPNNRARKFLDWFIYSDNSIDGQSKKKAYTLIESGLLDSMEPGTVKCLQQIHGEVFAADSCLSFWRSLRLCRTDSSKNHLERWHTVLSCRVPHAEFEANRSVARNHFR